MLTFGASINPDTGIPQMVLHTTTNAVDGPARLGIMTVNPQYEIDVTGDIRATGATRFGNAANIPFIQSGTGGVLSIGLPGNQDIFVQTWDWNVPWPKFNPTTCDLNLGGGLYSRLNLISATNSQIRMSSISFCNQLLTTGGDKRIAMIEAYTAPNFSAGALTFWTKGADPGVIAERMRIDADGVVSIQNQITGSPLILNRVGSDVWLGGIGTYVAPPKSVAMFDVNVAPRTSEFWSRLNLMSLTSSSNQYQSQITFCNILVSPDSRIAMIEARTGAGNDTGSLAFYTKPSGGALTIQMVIDELGRFRLYNLPTSPVGLFPGQVWNNGGVLNVT
jgi:hypothetical protein